MQSGEYDGVSASGDATTRLIAGGEVSPVNVDLIPNYADVFEDLKLQQHNSVDGVPYGVPHGRGANLLVFNTEAFADGAPDSWGVMFDGGTPADGAVSVYDSPIYIADAAVYLMATQPDLGITNPYALDQEQFDAAIALLEQQQGLVGQFWSLYTDQQAALEGGTVLAGTTWQVIVNLAPANGATIDAVKPVEGATGWSDTWMISSEAAHPNCMYMWMDWIISPGGQRGQVAEWFGEAPSNAKSCDLTAERSLRDVPRRGRRLLGGRVLLADADRGVPRRAHRRHLRPVHRMGQRLERAAQLTGDGGSGGTSAARAPAPPPRTRRWGLGALLGAAGAVDARRSTSGRCPLLVAAAFFTIDPISNEPTTRAAPARTCAKPSRPREFVEVVLKSIGVAAAVTVLCIVMAVPMAFYIAKIAKPRYRRALIVATVLPLWAGYLVKGYAWKAMLRPASEFGVDSGGGFLASVFGFTPGFGWTAVILALTYLWLPYMVLPDLRRARAAAVVAARRQRRPRRPAVADVPLCDRAVARAVDRRRGRVHVLALAR